MANVNVIELKSYQQSCDCPSTLGVNTAGTERPPMQQADNLYKTSTVSATFRPSAWYCAILIAVLTQPIISRGDDVLERRLENRTGQSLSKNRSTPIGPLAIDLGPLPQNRFPSTAWRQIHVSVDGHDNNSGSSKSPLRTIQAAVTRTQDRSVPSDIIVHAGTYRGRVIVGRNGADENRKRPSLTIQAARRPDEKYETVTIVGGISLQDGKADGDAPGVYSTRCKVPGDHVPHVWELDTRQRYTCVADLAAVIAYPASFYYRDQTLYFHTSDGHPPVEHQIGLSDLDFGIYVRRADVTIAGLRFRDFLATIRSAAIVTRGSRTIVKDCRASNCAMGFHARDRAQDAQFRRCHTEDVGTGIYSGGINAVVDQCRLTKTRDAFMVRSELQDDCGILIYYPALGGIVRGNLVSGFYRGTFVKCERSEFVLEHNTYVNNVFVGLAGAYWGSHYTIRNNIVSGSSNPLYAQTLKKTNAQLANDVIDHNCFWNEEQKSQLQQRMWIFHQNGKCGQTIYADPRFAAADRGDYRLLFDSPCVGAGYDGKDCGAFGVVDEASPDRQPPQVTLTSVSPAFRAVESTALFYKRDPWLGGARRRANNVIFRGRDSEWVTPTHRVTLDVSAQDALDEPTRMRYRLNDQEWTRPEPFQKKKMIQLPSDQVVSVVDFQVADGAGNWSLPVSMLWRVRPAQPKLIGDPLVVTNRHGALISFETDVPCRVHLEYGPTRQYGTTVDPQHVIQRSWIASREGHRAAVRSRARVQNKISLVAPQVRQGEGYHFRLRLEDETGETTTSKDYSFVVQGKPRTLFVANHGKDHGPGNSEAPWRTIQYTCDRALPGDKIVLLPGFYPGRAAMTHGGLPQAPLTIRAQQPGTVVLDGRWTVASCLQLRSAPNVVVDGLEIRWYRKSGIDVKDSTNVQVKNCKIWNRHWAGFPDGIGIMVQGSPGFRAEGNLVFRSRGAFSLVSSAGFTLDHNTCVRCVSHVLINNSAAGSVCRNNCLVYSHLQAIRVIDDELKEFNCDYNNLGARLREPPAYETKGHPGLQEVLASRINLVPEDPLLDVASKWVVRITQQKQTTKLYYSFRNWQEETGLDRHSIFADPQFVDVANHDFTVRETSPNIRAGEKGATIGAF